MQRFIFFHSPQSTPDPFPCVLEYLPYRQSDATAPRDRLRHPWLASHGVAACRADVRGTGDSGGGGPIEDEYHATELGDGCQIIGGETSFFVSLAQVILREKNVLNNRS